MLLLQCKWRIHFDFINKDSQYCQNATDHDYVNPFHSITCNTRGYRHEKHMKEVNHSESHYIAISQTYCWRISWWIHDKLVFQATNPHRSHYNEMWHHDHPLDSHLLGIHLIRNNQVNTFQIRINSVFKTKKEPERCEIFRDC